MPPGDGTSDYTYDDTSQLTAATHTYQTNESYSYDANGNRTNTGYTTGTNNRLTSDGTYNYLYDDAGNRTKKIEISSGDYIEYTWDHRNHLITVTFRDSLDVKTKQIEYDYDAFDRRIARDLDSNGNGTIDSTENYVYDGSDIVLVFDGSNNLTNRYLHGPAVDQIFADEDAVADVLWSLTDNLGTVRDVADYNSSTDTTSVANHLKYDAFGNITAQSDSSVGFLYSYTGRIYDADAELYYYRARWYDPAVGRFISEDPIGFAAGDANLSRYTGNSTPNRTDPSGKDWLDDYTGWFDDSVDSATDLIENYPEKLADPETITGQLIAGDIYGNQIWGDPGVYINADYTFRTPVVPVKVGFGFELIYDWSNDGNPGTGWNLFLYPEFGLTISKPGPSLGLGIVNVYNFDPEEYQGTFLNASVNISHPNPIVGGPSMGFSATPEGIDQYFAPGPVTKPYSYYAGWQWGSPSAGLSWQQYVWLNNPERIDWWNLSPF